ncbi:type III sulfide quinone reductase, selenoprotein subtype [Desulfopila inferna]|uniref:type III sulfide quinone reductase, selenoprotein subtype n=1 Tax=Desulfopila inferna TaxID=468528 RepID=UPI0019661B6D|nr:FAD/NAD(P)-binding oxidoreductase [Desulfopila inferna]MBM9604515.1 NAD(P)/FAD-dependent oxidoreductase [Desulfopila inferna]
MKKKLVILGAGCAGSMVANKLRKLLKREEWSITIIDQDDKHIYQPGLLFIPFGIYTAEDVIRSRSEFIPKGVNFIIDEIIAVDPDRQQVETTAGSYGYDKLIVCTGVSLAPEEIPGLMEGWQKTAYDFYTLEGAVNLSKAMREFRSGRLVLNIAEFPFKCPVAPLEFVYLADAYFTERGVRDQIEIELVTPLPGAFTKPKASAFFSQLIEQKNIKITANFDLVEVDCTNKKIISAGNEEIEFDLLVSIPPNVGAHYLVKSGVAMDEIGYVKTNNHSLKAENFGNMYVLGDATTLPTSKAGSVAHFSAEILVENFMREINGEPVREEFDGHANCFIETGFDKAALIDFNYKYEPLPGKFPLPGLGPFSLLGESKANHWGKMMFKWVYWNKLISGEDMPLEAQMSLAGKIQD